MIRYLFPKNIERVITWGFFLFFFVICFLGEANSATIIGSSFSVSESYSDNVFFSKNKVKRRTGDFVTTVSPMLNAAYTSKNIGLRVRYGGSLKRYSKNSRLDGYFQTLNAGIDFPSLSRKIKGLSLRISDVVRYVPQLQAFSFDDKAVEGGDRFERTLQGGEGVQSERINTLRNRAEISVDYPLSRRFSIATSYANIITRYSGGNRDNTVFHNGDLVGTYHHAYSRKTKWNGSYGAFITASKDNVALFHRISAGMVHQIDRMVSIQGKLGTVFIENVPTGLTFELGISKHFKNGRLNLKYKNDIVRGQGVIEKLSRRQSILGAVNWNFGQKKSVFLQSGYASTNTVQVNDVNVTTYTITGGGSITFLAWLHGSLSYSYLNQDSKGGLRTSGESNAVMLSLTAIGDKWMAMK